MLYDVLTPGSPSLIWAEFATTARGSTWAEEDPENRRDSLGASTPALSDEILRRRELLADPLYSEALLGRPRG